MSQPLLIALNGLPTSGKSTVQEIMREEFGIVPIDDGMIGRRHCAELFGIPLEDLQTQQGKLKTTRIQGVDWQNRKVVGEYLAALEALFGELTVPNWAIRTALEDWNNAGTTRRNVGYSFGSTRRGQGRAYLDAGGVVVEIVRPGVEPTGNVWDLYDKSLVTHRVVNDGGLSLLRARVKQVVAEIIANRGTVGSVAA